MTVREVLTPLVKEALKRLCQRRNLLVSGTKGEILRRLAHSYHGDLSAVVLDLRRRDLLTITSAYSDSVELPTRLWALPVSELREVCLAVFEERYTAPEGPAALGTGNGANEERQSERPDGGDFDIGLYATGHSGTPGAGHVDEKSLAGMAGGCRQRHGLVRILCAGRAEDHSRRVPGRRQNRPQRFGRKALGRAGGRT